jgi:hypothetical protein
LPRHDPSVIREAFFIAFGARMKNLDGRLYQPGQALAISEASIMFQLTATDFADWKSQIVTSNFAARRTWGFRDFRERLRTPEIRL